MPSSIYNPNTHNLYNIDYARDINDSFLDNREMFNQLSVAVETQKILIDILTTRIEVLEKQLLDRNTVSVLIDEDKND